jgi:hypothetical protein
MYVAKDVVRIPTNKGCLNFSKLASFFFILEVTIFFSILKVGNLCSLSIVYHDTIRSKILLARHPLTIVPTYTLWRHSNPRQRFVEARRMNRYGK